jgi:hypothetical protein
MSDLRAAHDELYSSTLREQLDRARRGLLSVEWRDELASSPMMGVSSDHDP